LLKCRYTFTGCQSEILQIMAFPKITRRRMFAFVSGWSILASLITTARARPLANRSTTGEPLYPQTAAELAAGVAPTNYAVPSHLELGFVSVNRYGADPTGAVDATAIIQGALDVGGIGSTVVIPAGTYRINGTLNKYPGQIIKGSGWATTPLTYQIAGGTVLKQYSLSDIPLIQTNGTSDATQLERGGLRDIALLNSVGSATVGTGYYANYARQELLSNVYISSFAKGIVFANVCWLCHVDHCRVMDFTNRGLVQQGSSEDNLFSNCQFSGYHPQSVAVHCQVESANTTFINCCFQGCNYGVFLDQYDTNGDGTGTPYPMHATFIGCLVEDIVQAVFMLISSVASPALGSRAHPGITVNHLRAYNSGNFTQTRQITGALSSAGTATLTFVLTPAADVPPVGSQIIVSGMTPSGYNGAYIVTASTTTSVSYTNATTGFTRGGKIAYGALANNNQTLVYAQNASQISVQDIYAYGFSYGATLMGATFQGTAGRQYGHFYRPGTPVGPVLWAQDNNAVYGTARFLGVTANITKIPGDRPVCRLNTAPLSYTASTFTRVPFTTVVSDFCGWASNTNQGWVPLRNQTVRFRAQIYIDSAPVGRYSLSLHKNGTKIATLFDLQNGTAGVPILLSGEFDDIPNGNTDYYHISVYSSASWTLDAAAGSTWAVAEIVGT
jgi:hypothetical protein